MKKFNVLGAEWTLTESTQAENKDLYGVDGYCDSSIKECVVEKMEATGELRQKKNLPEHKKVVIRHEIIHAFLYESGLDACSWATNEEMVDYFALQFPKMLQAFKEVDCL